MENTQRSYIKNISFLIVGLVAGGLIWGYRPHTNQMATHMMPDGTLMSNTGSDMSAMMMDMNAALKGKTGDAFDQEFLAEMIVHHQGAIDMAKLALTNAKHQEIKDLASAIITAQEKEITQMKQWQKEWYKK